MSSQAINRRTLLRDSLLRGTGIAIGLPWLEAMVAENNSGSCRANENNPLLRTVFVYAPNGMHMPQWTPEAEGRNFEFKSILAPVAHLRSKINILSNLTLDGARAHGDGGGDHARSAAAYLTGAHPRKTDGADIENGVSIDQEIASHLGNQNRLSSLELGLEGSSQAGSCDTGYSCAYSSNLAWRNPTSPLAKEVDPAAVFDRLFTSGKESPSNLVTAQRKQRRKSVLDFALSEAKKLESQLGSADRRKLDEYFYSIRDVEKRLIDSEKLQIGEDGIPNYPRPAGVPKELDEHCRLMFDMIVLAIQSGSTRIVTLMLANEGNNRGYPELGAPEGHHDLSHHGGSIEKQAKIETINIYYAQKLAVFLDSLNAVSEGTGTLLDNTLVVYGSGISDGDRHNHDQLPVLMAGGSTAGRFETGQHIRYAKETPLCNFYVWLMQRYGIESTSFGDSTGVVEI